MAALRKKAAIDDASKLSGVEKAAVVLLALGEDHAGLWEALDDEEIKEISQAMSSLGTVSSAVVESLQPDMEGSRDAREPSWFVTVAVPQALAQAVHEPPCGSSCR